MCSNIDSDNLPDLVEKVAILDRDTVRTCRRCPKEPFVLLQKKDPFCRECFFSYCSHKFRSTIGKSGLVKREDRILIAFSGGASSSALVDFVAEAVDISKGFKRLILLPAIVFVDESGIVGQDGSNVDDIIERMNKTGWPTYYTSLKMATIESDKFYVDARDPAEVQRIREISDSSCANCFNQLKSLTAKEELIRRLRTQLIVDVGRLEKFQSIFLGSNATRLSIQLIADTAQGKGSQIHLETGFCDDRFDIPILKPLRELVSKEIVYYCRMRSIVFDANQDLGTKKAVKSSLSKLSENFINGLQTDFPATVYTLFKIAEKLKSTFAATGKCDLCGAANDAFDDKDDKDCSAQAALLLSQQLSRSTTTGSDDDGQEGGKSSSQRLCYGCMLIANELPSSVDDMPEKIVRARATKESIQEFLIETDN